MKAIIVTFAVQKLRGRGPSSCPNHINSKQDRKAMNLSHIEHLGIAVKSIEASLPYYEGILGLKCYNIEEVAEYHKDNTASFLILDEKPIASQQWAMFSKTLSKILNEQVIVKIKSDFRSNEDKYFYNEIKESLRPVQSLEGENLQREFIF